MGSSNIRDILTCFSPSLDFFAITSGDGRIKIWDTVKGQLQTEFSDIVSNNETNLFARPEERGHLSNDYTCMKWVSFDSKKKRKICTSLLVLGTGSGDVLAIDVSGGQLRWRISDCHPGGVNAIAFATQRSFIYSSGVDGMVCQIDSISGNLIRKFKASTKAVSSMCVSLDGKIIATAASQMKIFSSLDHKKIQKFTGHPGPVRCMTMSDDGNYVFSSASGERYVTVWSVYGSKKKSASCVLAMEHPPVYLDCRHMDNGEADGSCFYILAISEVGVCYIWYGKNIEELQKAKSAKISLSSDSHVKIHKGALPSIFAARIQNLTKRGSVNLFLAQGYLIKPSFEKVVVHHGEDLSLNIFRDGLLLPLSQSRKAKKQPELQTGATALDRSNAEGALLPVPKVLDDDRIKRETSFHLGDEQSVSRDVKDDDDDVVGIDTTASPMEDRLKSLGILGHLDNKAKSTRHASLLKEINLEAITPARKMRATILSLSADDAYKTLNALLDMWLSRSCSGKYVLPWIYSILVHRGHQIMSQDPENATMNTLYKITKTRGSSAQCLLQLSGRLQLVIAQIDKASHLKTQPLLQENDTVDSDDEDESVDDVLFGEDNDESQTSDEDSEE